MLRNARATVKTCCFIVPPHILKKLNRDAKTESDRDSALETMRLTENLRGRRSVTRRLAAAPALTEPQLRREVYTANNRQKIQGKLLRAEGQAPVSDSAANQAYDNVGLTYQFYHEVFSRSSVDGRGEELDSWVHYGSGFDNAFWDGREMVYGDGRVFHDFTGAIDVIAHELTHGVTQYMVPPDGLDYHDQPGALNESWSDVFGSMCKQWVLKQTVDKADWLIGNTIVPQGWKALRSMSNPGTAYPDDPQPGNMSAYVQGDDDNGGVHINSGIPNRAFYLAAKNLSPQGSSWEKAGKIWYQAYRLLNADSDFKAAAQATVKAASMLFGDNGVETKGVSDAWAQVGVLG